MSSPTTPTYPKTFCQDEVRDWTQNQVTEWLSRTNLGQFTSKFQEHNITGIILLDIDYTALKEMDVKTVGERVKIAEAIKGLRRECHAGNAIMARSQQRLHESANHVNSSAISLVPDSLSKKNLPNRSNSFSRFLGRTEIKKAQRINDIDGKLPPPPPSPVVAKRNSFEGGIMSMEKVKQTCVKVYGEDGQTRIVNLHDAKDAKAIMAKVLHKFSIDASRANDYRIFVGSSSSQQVRALNDEELTEICNSTDRPEKEKLTLRKHHKFPSIRSFQRRGTDASSTSSKQSIWPDKQATLDIITGSPVQPRKLNFPRSNQHQPKNFFGERPPSELISSNLPSFFPTHNREVLETANVKRLSTAHRASSIKKSEPRASVRNSVLPELVSVLGILPDKFVENEENEENEEHEENDEIGDRDEAEESENNEELEEDNAEDSEPSSTKPVPTPELVTESDASSTQTPTTGNTALSSAIPNGITLQKRSSSLVTAKKVTAEPVVQKAQELPVPNGKLQPQQPPPSHPPPSVIVQDAPIEWMKGALIGKGTFGDVYLGLNKMSGELMAVKQVELPAGNGTTPMTEALQREISLLKDLQHENIVQYLGSQSDDVHFSIFLEYVPGGSVAGLLASYGAFQEPLVNSFVRQILRGLNYLHCKDIIHRDIKGANVLVDNKGVVKIADFGISRKVDDSKGDVKQMVNAHRPSLQGSIFWMAPEVVQQTDYTLKADIWSLGCMVVEMFTGDHPFPDLGQMQAMFKIGSKTAPTIPDHISEAAMDFLRLTFKIEHEERPTASELLMHSFLLKEEPKATAA